MVGQSVPSTARHVSFACQLPQQVSLGTMTDRPSPEHGVQGRACYVLLAVPFSSKMTR